MSVLRAIAIYLCGFLMMRFTRAQIILPGGCPDVQAMEDITPEKYLGRWYEAEKYFFLFEFTGKCITADYGPQGNNISVVNKQISKFSGAESSIRGYAYQDHGTKAAKFTVVFPELIFSFGAPYWVIDTDYDSYSVVWSCNDFKKFHAFNAWILTRERNPPKSVIEKAYAAIDKNSISRSYFMKTDQTDCPNNKD